MDLSKLHKKQKQERKKQTEEILNSPEEKRLIVSGPGTGKTYLFDRILKKNKAGKKLVLTFIRRLIAEIDHRVQIEDTCKTFHEFAKGLLHSQKGSFDLQPYLTDIIKKDAELLGLDLEEFDTKFQDLNEYGPEISFYIKRGDYYQTVSFNDSVYRLFKIVSKDKTVLPKFSQIVIDEYQDFNKLETEFIKILEKRGPILIAGDDDQALYDGRSASSKYIKDLCKSGRYKVFKPKYCSRCTDIIIKAVKEFLIQIQKLGFFDDRVEKDYECYLPDKEADSIKYPKIDFAECSTIKTVAKYIKQQIKNINKLDIKDSFKDDNEYPTALIIGPVHYLKVVYKELNEQFDNIQFTPSEEISYSVNDGYRLLLKNQNSNLGWRIIAEFSVEDNLLADLIAESESDTPFIDLIPDSLIDLHKNILELIRKISNKDTYDEKFVKELEKFSPENYKEIVRVFKYQDEEQKEKTISKTEPSILLVSYKGAKGLSGGHIFLLGAHNGSLPKNKNMISDVEISQFLVAMTRTRKKLHFVSNKWYISPKINGRFVNSNERSIFIDWIPNKFINNLGYLKSEDIK